MRKVDCMGNALVIGDQVTNYLKIVPWVDCSGTINKYGHITKKGNGVVRSLLYQVVWAIVRSTFKREEDIDNGDSAKDGFNTDNMVKSYCRLS